MMQMVDRCHYWARAAAWALAIAAVLMSAPKVHAQSGTITVTKLSDTVHMLQGKGGNIAVSVGTDGVIMIDDQFAPASTEIAKAIKAIDDRPIRFVINTHWHGDHTGGNKNFRALGATIVAHDNVRREMIGRKFKTAQGKFVADDSLPTVTFRDRISFHLNGETVVITKVPASHTNGDALVHFTGSDVLHMGDVFFNGLYTFFDGSSGGRFEGMIEALGIGLEIAGAGTKIVPGHGALATRDDLKRHRDRMIVIRDRVKDALAKGVSVQDFIASKPTKDLEDAFGKGYKVMDAAKFLRFVYVDLKRGG